MAKVRIGIVGIDSTHAVEFIRILNDVDAKDHVYIAGIHEVLRRQGLMAGRWCLNPGEDLSPGQMEEIDRVTSAYPHLIDGAFVRENLHRWLA